MRPLVSRKSKMDASIVLGGVSMFCVREHESNTFAGRRSQEKNIATFSMTKPEYDRRRAETPGFYLNLRWEAAERVRKLVVEVIFDPAT